MVLFADDTTINVIDQHIHCISESLSNALARANQWLLSKHLSRNIQKTKSMLIHSSRKKALPLMSVAFHDTPIEQVRVMKFLGVNVNDCLTWDDHINHMTLKASRSISLLRKLSCFFPKAAVGLGPQTLLLVTSSPFLATAMWYGMPVPRKRLQNYYQIGYQINSLAA